MKKHLPLIVVISSTLVVLAVLHFFVFGPMRNDYKEVLTGLDDKINKLKTQIDSVKWPSGERPDPRNPSFTWNGLLTKVEGAYGSQVDSFKNLVQEVDVTYQEVSPQESGAAVLARLKSLQEVEEKNAQVMRVLEKWGLNTKSDRGFNGSRPLSLLGGGYRSYSGEGRIEGRQGTLQLAINIEPWFLGDGPVDPKRVGREVLFHAGKQRPKMKDAPASAPPTYSSELLIVRDGLNLIATLRNASAGPAASTAPGQPGVIERNFPVSIAHWLKKDTAGSIWKVLKVSWGLAAADVMFYVDGKTATQLNQEAAARPQPVIPGLTGVGGAPPAFGGGARGGFMTDEYRPRGLGMMGMGGMGGGYGGGAAALADNPNAGATLEPLDGFVVGCDFQRTAPSKIMYDALRIWNAPSKNADPPVEPLFAEDFEGPFGSDDELKKSLEQMVRYYGEMYDPNNQEEVRDTNQKWYNMLAGCWGTSPGMRGIQTQWVEHAKTIGFLSHAAEVYPKFGDMERLARQIGITLPGPGMRKHLAMFLTLATDLCSQLLEAQVDRIQWVEFLNWSNTVSDEPLKTAFKEAYQKLQADVSSPVRGPMGMMGMGMMGMGMGMGMSEYGYSPYGMPGGDRDDERGGGAPGGDPGAADEATKARMKAMKEAQDKRMKQQEEQMKKFMEFEENQKKYQVWLDFNNRNEIPPDFYAEYQKQMASAGKDFFVRYSMQVSFYCPKDRLARALHAMEFNKRMAFISKVKITPSLLKANQVQAVVNVEYNFMKELQANPMEAAPAPGQPGAVPQVSGPAAPGQAG